MQPPGAAPELEIQLFGHPQFLAGGKPIRLAKRSVTIPLAAYLLLHRDEAVSRNFLAFTLWANESEELALSELRRYVYLLNKALPKSSTGQPWIRADDDVLRWNYDNPMRLDVAEFERLSASPATYAQAVRLYAGDLLEDTYDDWVLASRERLRTLYFADLAGLIVQHREARDFKRAAEYAAQLLAADPWREDIVRLMMVCRYEAGDSAGALSTFDAFAKRLQSELGVDPMPETLVAREAIVRNAPVPASLGTPHAGETPQARADTAGHDVLPFAGRQLELDQLRATWVRAARGNGGLTLVSGQAGMGKSRLVAELAASVELEGGRICIGSTTYAERFPYEGIVEALRYCLPFVASLDLDPLRASIIAKLLPELSAWRDGVPEIPPLDPRREQARLLDAVASCFVAMARPRPMLIILEDLHWAGPATVSAIAFLARRLSRSAVLIVGTYREEEVGRTHPLRAIHQELRGEQLVQSIALRPLSLAAIEQIVERLPVAPDERARFASLGYDRSEGNPLFLTEALREAMSPDGEPGTWAGTDVLRTLIASRLGTLSDEGREIAELAAVTGHAFQVDLVRDVAGIDESKVLDGIYELMDRHLVREAGVRRRFDFAFTHHLIHNAIYDSIDPAVRTRRHRRIAQILEERSSDARGFAAADLALHRERGGDPAGAGQSHVDAAEHASRLFANDETVRHASRAIELAADDRTRARALLVRERALGRGGDREGQGRDIEAIGALASALGDEELAWEALMRRLRLENSLGDRAKQDRTVAELEQRASAAGDTRHRAEALLARAAYLIWLTSHAQAEAPATKALDLYERMDDSAGQVEALVILADIATNSGDLDRSRRLLRSLRKRAEGQADQTLVLRAIAAATATELQQHRIDSAAELAAEGLALSRSIGDREEEASMLQRLATVATWQSDFDGARRLFSEAADALIAIGNQRGISHALANQVVLAIRLGLLEEAERLGGRLLEVVERTGERRPLAVTKVNMSLNRLLMGDSASAKRLALEALQISRDIKFPLFEGAALSNLGNAERVSDDLSSGLRHLEEGLAMRKPLLALTDLLDDYCDLAVGYLQAGRLDDAQGAAKTLLEIAAESTDGAFWPQYCYWAAALVRRASGDVAGSKALLERAIADMERFAGAIADPATRAAFTRLPLCREVAAAAERDEWPAYAGGADVRYTPVRRQKKKSKR